MTRLLRSELLKLRTTRTSLTLLLYMLGLILLVVLLHVFSLPVDDLAARDNQLKLLGWGTSIGALFAALVGAMSITAEIRHGLLRRAPQSSMTPTLPASSRSYRDSRPRAALHQRPSGRSRSPRIDPSTITSPATRPSTQISPGVRGTIGPTGASPLHNHSPPRLTKAPVQISGSGVPPHLPARAARSDCRRGDPVTMGVHSLRPADHRGVGSGGAHHRVASLKTACV